MFATIRPVLGKSASSVLASGVLLLSTSSATLAQGAVTSNAGQTPQAYPTFALTIGSGNVLGWLGGSVEHYFLNGRVSGAAGGGYIPETDEGNPGTAAFGAAVRGYLGGDKHRAFLELSASLLSLDWTPIGGALVDFDRNYGPGISAGYRYTATRGFTFIAGAGAGWAVGNESIEAMGILGVGYTWRR